jgi:hypothetical protein
VIADGDDLEDRVLLAVTLLAPVVVAAALLEDGDLLAFRLGDDLGGDGEAVGRLQIAAVAGEQDVAERDLVTGVAVELLDDDLVSGMDAVLLPTRADDCEHDFSSSRNLIPARSRSRKPRQRPGKRAAYGRGVNVSTI